MNATWRKIFAPELIFTASTVAALSPYVVWYFGFKPPLVERLDLTYIPLFIWACGALSFWVGARFARKRGDRVLTFRLSDRNMPMTLLLSIAVAVVVVQAYFATRDVYGVLPIFDYLSSTGGLDIWAANDQQQYSASGQIGLLAGSLYALNSFFLVAVLQRIRTGRGSRLLLATFFIVTALIHLLNAKRGGLYSMVFYLLAGLSIYFGDPSRALAALAPRRSRFLTRGALIAIPLILVFGFGYIASIRTRGKVEASTGQIFDYLEYPLMNLELQTRNAGFGPGDFKPLAPFRFLTPYKYAELSDSLVTVTPRIVQDSPSGIYEYVHWCWGIWGVIGYSIVLGFVSRWLYERTLQSLPCLLAYCYFAVAIAFAQTSNQVLILAYVPFPLIAVFLLGSLVSTERLRRSRSTRFVQPMVTPVTIS